MGHLTSRRFPFFLLGKKYFNGLFEFCGFSHCNFFAHKQEITFSRVITKWALLQEDEKYTKKTSNSKTISKTLKCSNLKKN